MRLWLATQGDKPALARRYDAYLDELLPDRDAEQPDPYFDLYWTDPETRFPYLFGLTDPQGFAFVRVPDEADIDFELAEFCVAHDHRRRGVGTDVLPLIFARHPGRWDLGILHSNIAGMAFWPKALRRAGVRDVTVFESDTSRSYEFTVP